jgi:hypothetical protein
MSTETRYTVRPEKTTRVVNTDPIDLESVPCWVVTRVTGGMGWHIGKYETEAVANAVAAALTVFIPQEID